MTNSTKIEELDFHSFVDKIAEAYVNNLYLDIPTRDGYKTSRIQFPEDSSLNFNFVSKAEVIKLIDEHCYNSRDYKTNSRIDNIRQKIIEMPTEYDLINVIKELLKLIEENYLGISHDDAIQHKAYHKAFEIVVSSGRCSEWQNGD